MTKQLYKIRRLLSRSQKKTLLFLSILLIFGAVLEIIGLGVLLPGMRIILDAEWISKIDGQLEFIDLSAFTHRSIVSFSLVFIFLVYSFKAVYLLFLNFKSNRLIEGLGGNITTRLFTKYLSQPYKYHVYRDFSDIVKNIQVEVNYFTVFNRSLLTFIVESFLSIAVLTTIVLIEPIGASVMAVIIAFFALLYFQVTKKLVRRWGIKRQKLDRQTSKITIDTFSGIKDVKLLGKEGHFIKDFIQLVREKIILRSNSQTISRAPLFYMEIVSVIGLIIFVQTMFFLDYSPNEVVSKLGVFVAATFRLIPSANRILLAIQNIKYYNASVEKIHDELFYQFEDKDLLSTDEVEIEFKEGISIKNVSFSYGKTKVLNDLDFEIKKGTTIGITGASGSGKSTLIDIIANLLPPESGSLMVDGRDINKENINWKREIGYVGQDVFLIDDTIEKNIAFGVAESDIDAAKIKSALKAAQILKFVETLPNGINTKVGERGIQVSGGQKQRLGIARALYNDPSVLIFDEATSSLDTKTESEVMESIYQFKNKKTIIIVAHRISTLSKCDKIYEIAEGQIS